MYISSLENKKVKEWTKLHNKKYRGEEFLLLDEKMVEEAAAHNLLKTLIYAGEEPFAFKETYEVSEEVMDKIAKKEGLKYIGIGLPLKETKEFGRRVMIGEDLQDPLNIGRIIASAYNFGFETLILSKGSADIYNEKCLSAVGTSLYKINICHADIEETVRELKNSGFKVFATGLKSYSLELYEVKIEEKMAFILGNEGSGIKESTFKIVDDIIKIDMHNIDSLNVAMAGAIIMYRFSKSAE